MDCLSRNNRHASAFAPSSPSSDNELHHRVSAGSHDVLYTPSPTMYAQKEQLLLPQLGLPQPAQAHQEVPSILGMPLKYVSLVTLAVQNATLTIIMHYSRVSTSPEKAYSAASAVLVNEVLKGSISLAVAFSRTPPPSDIPWKTTQGSLMYNAEPVPFAFAYRARRVVREVFSSDCWKLSIPAILYVIQNNLQYVAATNLDVATFQVTYQMKILTTAGFSVILLRKRLTSYKWLALLLLAVGVGIVQIQTGGSKSTVGYHHEMHPIHGFFAVTAACFTSGLAGVYFEMVLKGSQADLWVRNVQLSLFSLLPALVPVFFSPTSDIHSFNDIFRNFGFWAWATVLIQVFGGLVTAVVIKYSDNIMKGFATSLSIIISFLASVALFHFSITPSFIVGATTVLGATWMYNQPDKPSRTAMDGRASSHSYPDPPVHSDEPIIGMQELDKKRASLSMSNLSIPLPSPRMLADKVGFSRQNSESVLPAHVLGMSDANSSAVSLSSVESGWSHMSRDPLATHTGSSGYTTRSTVWNGRPSTSISSATSSRTSSPPLTRPPSTGAR